jgi:hypothetical protein
VWWWTYERGIAAGVLRLLGHYLRKDGVMELQSLCLMVSECRVFLPHGFLPLPSTMSDAAKGSSHQSLCRAVWTFTIQNCELNKPLFFIKLALGILL